MDSKSTILLAGGGTGGHLYPGIAVAEALRGLLPDVTPLFLCTNRSIDRTILEPTGFAFQVQPIVPLRRSISGLLRFWKGWRETHDLIKQILRQHRPLACLGLGGYAASAAVRLAARDGLPTAILNPDVIPGKANQFLMQSVQAVCCQFDATAEHVRPDQRHKLRTTGCPIRSDIQTLPPRKEAAARLGLDPMLRTLMVTGASQGAKTINEAVVGAVTGAKMQGWQILHLAGQRHANAVRASYRDESIPARVIDFTPAMADVWAVTDLAISRSGASTCAELTACGVPAVLLPYPFHKDMHQRANARILVEAGAAVLLEDQRDARRNTEQLKPILESLLYDANRRQRMAESARSLSHPDAAAKVAQVLAGLIEGSDVAQTDSARSSEESPIPPESSSHPPS